MKKSILVVSLSLACAIGIQAQQTETRATGDAASQTSVGAGEKIIKLDSGTRLSGELQNSVDVRKAKVGDQVVLKTTQAIKSGGKTVVGKGAKLVGRVTEVAQKTKGESQSRVGILFERLEDGSLAVPISASISSITSGNANVRRNDEDAFSTGASSSARAGTAASAGSGGLLGGTGGVLNSTTSTVGNVVGGTSSAVGSTVHSTTNVVGSTAAGVGGTLGRIQISGSTSTSVEGSSVLSLQGENLRLEKGTNFNLVLTQSASAGASKNQ